MMELNILGSGTAVPTISRGAAGYLIVTDQEKLMLDCGPGSSRKIPLAGYSLNDLDRLIISHFHPDHVNDLAAILFGSMIKGFLREKPLELVGPPGLKQHYEKIVNLFGRWVVPDEFELTITELMPNDGVEDRLELIDGCLITRYVAHSYPALGYRIETSSGVIVYSGDSDYCTALVDLCAQADLAILECSSHDEEKIKGHLTPALAGRIAAEAGVKHLILSHFYPHCQPEIVLAQSQKVYQGEITLATDLMKFSL